VGWFGTWFGDSGTVSTGSGVVVTGSGAQVASIRDRMIQVIESITPTVLVGNRFRAHRNEGKGDFVDFVLSNPGQALRRFQVRDIGTMGPPSVSNTDTEWRSVIFEVSVAYPQSARYGKDQALDRDDAIRADLYLLEQHLGPTGAVNFSGSYPAATYLGDTSNIVRAESVDVLVMTQTMGFYSGV
jgi:hypothetical protein